jgi:ADP-ribose pyrophosphatase
MPRQPRHDDEPDSPWTTLGSERVFATPWLSLRQDRVRTHTGAEIEYTYLDHQVTVVPVLEDGRIALLRQYRYTMRAWGWETPAGSIEGAEEGAAAAARELAEEIGGTARTLRGLATFGVSNGISNQRMTVYLATGVMLGPTSHEATELMRVVPLARAEALRLAHAGAITDGITALALLLAEPHLPPEQA